MFNKYSKKLTSIFIILLFFVLLFPPYNSKAQEQVPPTNRLSYRYDSSTNKLTEFDSDMKVTHTFGSPLGIDGDTVIIYPNPLTTDEGLLAFKLEGSSNIYLLVRVGDSDTLGLFVKDSAKYFWNFIENNNGTIRELVGVRGDTVSSTGPVIENSKLNFSDEEKAYIFSMNGLISGGTSPSNGKFQKISGLIPSEKITESTVLCGKVKIDLTGSKYFDRLPADVKSKIQSGTWPSDFPGNPKMYLKYSNGYDAGGSNWQGWANASLDRWQNFKIPIQGDGTFKSENLRGLPVGKYKLTGVVYIRNDDPNNPNSVSRLDYPGSGWWKDYLSNWSAVEKSIEIFVTNKFEVEVKSSGNSGVGFENNGGCADLTFTDKGEIDPLSTQSNNDSTCKASGTGIGSMIDEGLCGMVLVLKKATDNFFKWAVSWMEKSIGIARNQPVTVDDTIKATSTPTGTGTSAGTGTTTGTAGTSSSTGTSSAVASATSNSPKEFRGVIKLSDNEFKAAKSVVNESLKAVIAIEADGGYVFTSDSTAKMIFYEPDSTTNKIKVKVTCSDSKYLATVNKYSALTVSVMELAGVHTGFFIFATKANLTAKWDKSGYPPDLSVKEY